MVLYPPILKSVISGKVDMVKRCLKEGATLKQVDSCGSSPLIIACMMGYIAIVKFLIEAGVDAESVDFCGNSAIHLSSKNGHVDIVKYLLDHGTNVNCENKYGWTAFMYATTNRHYKTLELLLQYGACIHIASTTEYKTPLHLACQKRHLKMAIFLVEHGADPSYLDSQDRTPLCFLTPEDQELVIFTRDRHLHWEHRRSLVLLFECINAPDKAISLRRRSGTRPAVSRGNVGSVPKVLHCQALIHQIAQFL